MAGGSILAFFSFSSAESGAGVAGGAGSATQITLTPTKRDIKYLSSA